MHTMRNGDYTYRSLYVVSQKLLSPFPDCTALSQSSIYGTASDQSRATCVHRMTPGLYRGSFLEKLGAGDTVLDHHARNSKHRQPAVVQLLVLHLNELRRISRLQAERVEAEVARLVVPM